MRAAAYSLATLLWLSPLAPDRAHAQSGADALIELALADLGDKQPLLDEMGVQIELMKEAQRRCDYEAWLAGNTRLFSLHREFLQRETRAAAVLKPFFPGTARYDEDPPDGLSPAVEDAWYRYRGALRLIPPFSRIVSQWFTLIRFEPCTRTSPGVALPGPATEDKQVGTLVPLPDQPALQPRSYDTGGNWRFVIGDECSANPAPAFCALPFSPSVNLASDSGVSCTYADGTPARLPLTPVSNGSQQAAASPQLPASPSAGSTPRDSSPRELSEAEQANALADIFFSAGPGSGAGWVMLPPGSTPPPSGPANSDDPSTWASAPPGGIPADALQSDGTYVSPATVDWLKTELDRLLEASRQRTAGKADAGTAESTPPAPAVPASGPPPAAADKPATTAGPPAGGPVWIGPVPNSSYTPGISSKMTSDPPPAGASPSSTTAPSSTPADTPSAPANPPPVSTTTSPSSTPPDTPRSSTDPNAPVPDDPQEIRVTIHFKLNVAALPQTEPPKTVEGSIAGLLVDVPALPGPPGTTRTRAAETVGAGQPALRCRNDGSGKCTATQRSGPPGNAPGSGTRPSLKHYRIDVPIMQTAGGVIETTGNKAAPDLTAPAGLYVTAQPFQVGERTFTRLGFAQPFGLSVRPDQLFQQRFGDKYKIDFCFDEAPMGAHGVASDILDSELPAASIKLSLSIRPRDARQ